MTRCGEHLRITRNTWSSTLRYLHPLHNPLLCELELVDLHEIRVFRYIVPQPAWNFLEMENIMMKENISCWKRICKEKRITVLPSEYWLSSSSNVFWSKDQKYKISRSESSINSRACLGHLAHLAIWFCLVYNIFLNPQSVLLNQNSTSSSSILKGSLQMRRSVLTINL